MERVGEDEDSDERRGGSSDMKADGEVGRDGGRRGRGGITVENSHGSERT